MGAGTSKAAYFEQVDSLFVSDSPRSEDSADSRPPSPTNSTLLIFDWDDTLLSSAAVSTQSATTEQLGQLQQTVVSLLRLSMSLGETMIVTNGNATWVRDSSQRYLPFVAHMLADIEVVSARALYEHMYPGNPYAWKREAFRRIMEHRLAQSPCTRITNLVALGDSPAEMEAAQQATKVLGSSVLVKTVKLRETPTIQQLIGQLNRVRHDLPEIVDACEPLSKRLEQRKLTPSRSPLASWGNSWRLAAAADWGRPATLLRSNLAAGDQDVPAKELPPWVFGFGDKLAYMTKNVAQKS